MIAPYLETLAKVWRRTRRKRWWYVCRVLMLPCSACILATKSAGSVAIWEGRRSTGDGSPCDVAVEINENTSVRQRRLKRTANRHPSTTSQPTDAGAELCLLHLFTIQNSFFINWQSVLIVELTKPETGNRKPETGNRKPETERNRKSTYRRWRQKQKTAAFVTNHLR